MESLRRRTSRTCATRTLLLATLSLGCATGRAEAAPDGAPTGLASKAGSLDAPCDALGDRGPPSRRAALAVFDLDGTLLDPAARTRTIFLAALRSPEAPASSPELERRIEGFPLERHAYDPRETLARMGVPDALTAFLLSRWKPAFLSDTYLEQDREVPGAARYVSALHAAGAVIVYLTGRNARDMLRGTVASLHSRGFPIGVAGTVLIMKPTPEEPDLAFKRDVVHRVLPTLGQVIAVYENEPANANLLAEAFPDAAAFLVETSFAKDVPLFPRIVRVKDWWAFDTRRCSAAPR